MGRPTLFELSKDSPLQVIGELIESVSPQAPTTPPLELLTYPAGPVTLSLHILLPMGTTGSTTKSSSPTWHAMNKVAGRLCSKSQLP